jgi:ribosomal protein S18 acetylase RimI-like enzyme
VDRPAGDPPSAHGRPEPRKARRDETATLARALAAAFEDDQVFGWVFPDPSRRPALLERTFALFLNRIWLQHEETYVVGDGDGVCVWEPPGTWKLGAGEQLALLPAMARAWGRLLPRALRALSRLESEHPGEPHYYLPLVGVSPASQGRGWGSLLMHPILRRCDAERVPAYLEATSPRNRALYERHEFEVTEEFRLGRGSPPLWRMWRAPR